MPYANGQIPLNLLIKTASGWNADGYWEHLWSPGTLAKWQALVADVLANEGVLLVVTPGWNVYRPLEPQKLAKQKYGPLAAWPGTSSHGGEYNGVPSMAIDCANWQRIGQAKFFAYAKKHGLIPGTFEREPWHLIDYQPWATPAGGGGNTIPKTQEEIMIPTVLEIKGDSDAAKSLYDMRTGKAIRGLSKDENSSLRKAEARGAAVYISVSAAEYKQRGGF